MNLEKQIKRHVIGRRHLYFAVALPGFEPVCHQELTKLSKTLVVEEADRGGILFSGRLTDIYLANLYLRTAGRILMRLGTFKASNFHQLVQRTQALSWALYLPAGAVPACKVASHRSRLYHSRAIAQRVSQGIAEYWHDRHIAPGEAMGQTLYVRINNDRVTLSLDSSGANLYKRGLKRHGAVAPLRETTAATILLHAGYRPGMPLVDPMCGAGTFSLEAALMAKNIAPGMQREFAFMQWPAFKLRQWLHLKKVAAQKAHAPTRPIIWASDIEHRACTALNQCIEDNGLADTVSVNQKNFFNLNPEDFNVRPGLVVINPPYGRRLASADCLNDFYLRLTDKLNCDFAGWRVALLAPKGALSNKFTSPLKSHALVHGGLALTLVTGKLRRD